MALNRILTKMLNHYRLVKCKLLGLISATLTITIEEQAEHFSIAAIGPRGRGIKPRPAPQLETLLSNPKITDPLDKLLGKKKEIASHEEILELGKALYAALIADEEIHSALDALRDLTGSKWGARLRLQIESEKLAALPWETLHNGEYWLSAQNNAPFVRKLALPNNGKPLETLEIKGALRILFVWAAPLLEGLDELKFGDIAKDLNSLLANDINKKRIEFEILPNASSSKLKEKLLNDYHIVCFAGHGGPDGIFLDDAQGEDIVENGENKPGPGGISPFPAGEFADALRGKQTRLVFFAACETSKITTKGKGYAEVLAQQSNLPAIVAMQFAIGDGLANPLTVQFLAALAAGRPVDSAMAEARSALIKNQQVNRDVFSPVLYLQAENGALFPKAKNWLWVTIPLIILISILAFFAINYLVHKSVIESFRTQLVSSEEQIGQGNVLDSLVTILQAEQYLTDHEKWFSTFENVDGRINTFLMGKKWLGSIDKHTAFSSLHTEVFGKLKIVNFYPKERYYREIPIPVKNMFFNTAGELLLATTVKGKVSVSKLVSGKPTPSTERSDDQPLFSGYLSKEKFEVNLDSSLLATINKQGNVRLWNLPGKEEDPPKLKASIAPGSNNGIGFSPDGKQLVAYASTSATVDLNVWDLSGKQAQLKSCKEHYIGFNFNTQNQLIVATLNKSKTAIRFSDYMTGDEVALLRDFEGNLAGRGRLFGNFVFLPPDGENLAVYHAGPTTAYFGKLDDTSWKHFTPIKGVSNIISDTHGDLITVENLNIIGQKSNTLFGVYYDPNKLNKSKFKLLGYEDMVRFIPNPMPNSKQFATQHDGDVIRLWDLERERVKEIKLKPDQNIPKFKSISISPDGKKLAIVDVNGAVRLLDFSPAEGVLGLDDHKLNPFKELKGRFTKITFNPKGHQLAALDTDNTIRLLDLDGNESVKYNLKVGDVIRQLIFSPDGQRLAVAKENGTSSVFDLGDKTLKPANSGEAPPSDGGTYAVAFGVQGGLLQVSSPSGENPAAEVGSISLNQTIRPQEEDSSDLWTDDEAAEFTGAEYPFSTVAIDAEDNFFVSADEEDYNIDPPLIHVWVRSGGEPLYSVNSEHSHGVRSISLSQNGSVMVTLGGDGAAKFWSIEMGNSTRAELVSKGCNWVKDHLANQSIDGNISVDGNLCKDQKPLEQSAANIAPEQAPKNNISAAKPKSRPEESPITTSCVVGDWGDGPGAKHGSGHHSRKTTPSSPWSIETNDSVSNYTSRKALGARE
jgi:WD40 repeat protein